MEDEAKRLGAAGVDFLVSTIGAFSTAVSRAGLLGSRHTT